MILLIKSQKHENFTVTDWTVTARQSGNRGVRYHSLTRKLALSTESKMYRKFFVFVFIFFLLFLINCSSTKYIAVPSFEYHKLKKEKKILVTLKDGQKYELTGFEFTDSHIKGTHVLLKASRSNETVLSEKVEINLEDVEFVHMIKIEHFKNKLGLGLLTGVVLCGLFVIGYYFFGHWGD